MLIGDPNPIYFDSVPLRLRGKPFLAGEMVGRGEAGAVGEFARGDLLAAFELDEFDF